MSVEKVEVNVHMSRISSNVEEYNGIIRLSVEEAGGRMICEVNLKPEAFANLLTNRVAKGSGSVWRYKND